MTASCSTPTTSLELTLADVLALAPTTNVDGQPGTTILIDGDADDTVDLTRMASGPLSGTWSVAGQETIDGVDYDIYVNSEAAHMRVLIDQEIGSVSLSVI